MLWIHGLLCVSFHTGFRCHNCSWQSSLKIILCIYVAEISDKYSVAHKYTRLLWLVSPCTETLVSVSIFLVRFQSCRSCHHWSAAIQSMSSRPWRKNSLAPQETLSSTAPNSEGLPHSMGDMQYMHFRIPLHPRSLLFLGIYLYHLFCVFYVWFLCSFIMKHCKCWIMTDTVL